MSERSPISINNRQTLLDLQATKNRLAVTQRQISTGMRINDPSDDPAGAALILDFSTSIGANQEYMRQIDTAGNFLNGAETSVGSVINDLQRLLEIGTQGVSPTNAGSPRAAMAPEVDALRTDLISLANTQQQGKYLFAGTATLTKPFNGPSAGPVTYAGNSGLITVDVSPSATSTMNLPGDQLFFGSGGQGSSTDLFQQVTDLRDGLLANNQAQIQTAFDNLKAMMDRFTSAQTDLGGRQAGLLALKDDLSGFTTTLQGIQNSVAAVDYPTAITQYSNDQTAQQVTLSSLSKVTKTNLFDFLS